MPVSSGVASNACQLDPSVETQESSGFFRSPMQRTKKTFRTCPTQVEVEVELPWKSPWRYK